MRKIKNTHFIKRFQNNAEYERTHGNLQGCLEFRQLVEWLRKYQKIEEILNSASYTENGTVYSYTYDEDIRVKHIRKLIEDGNDD